MKNGYLSIVFFSRVGLRTYQHPCTCIWFYSGTAIFEGQTVKIIQEKQYIHNSKGNLLWYLQIIRDHADYAHKSVSLWTLCGSSQLLTQNSILQLTVSESQLLLFCLTSKINLGLHFIEICTCSISLLKTLWPYNDGPHFINPTFVFYELLIWGMYINYTFNFAVLTLFRPFWGQLFRILIYYT